MVQRIDVEFSEPIDLSTLTVDDISVTRDSGTDNLLHGDSRVTIEDRGNNVYRIGGINWVQGFIADPQIADFTFTINGTGVQDLAGNPASGAISTTWTIDLVSPETPENQILIIEEVPDGTHDELPNAVYSGTVFEAGLTLVVTSDYTGEELYRESLADTNFSIPLRIPTEGRNQLVGRLIDSAGNTTDFDLPIAFASSLPPVVVSTTGFTPRFRRTTVDSFSISFAKPISAASLTRDDIQLTHNGAPVSLPTSLSLSPSPDSKTIAVSGLGNAASLEGSYQLTIHLDGIEGQDGRSGSGSYTEEWTLDRTPPITRVISTLLDRPSRQYFVAVDADSPASAASYSVFSVSPTSPLSLVSVLPTASPAIEYRGTVDEEYVFLASSSDQAGNQEPVKLTTGGAFSIILNSSFADELPPHMELVADTDVVFVGDWTITSPLVRDGVLTHQIRSDETLFDVKSPTPWQNPVKQTDVNHDGFVSPIDALVGINYLNGIGSGLLPMPSSSDEHRYYDVNGDGFISPIDVLGVVNELNRVRGEGEAKRLRSAVHIDFRLSDRIDQNIRVSQSRVHNVDELFSDEPIAELAERGKRDHSWVYRFSLPAASAEDLLSEDSPESSTSESLVDDYFKTLGQ